jgi:16S rRNA (uracil1498-N3)-methyltransferase
LNLILFEPAETQAPLPRSDPRAQHILTVLRRRLGDSFNAGLIDGPRGKATLVGIDQASLTLSFKWGEAPPPLYPISLVLGLLRPQTARKVLEEATALGVDALHFVQTERSEASYAQSRLWSTGEWRRHVIAGAQQAFSTRLPEVTWGRSLSEVLQVLPARGSSLALDNYEAPAPLAAASLTPPVVLALGPERGWSPTERRVLLHAGFGFVHLGERVLRVETACVAAVALVAGRLELL